MTIQIALDYVHRDDLLLLVGAFNVHVECSIRGQNSAWTSMRRYHGMEKVNENGAEIFLAPFVHLYSYI